MVTVTTTSLTGIPTDFTLTGANYVTTTSTTAVDVTNMSVTLPDTYWVFARWTGRCDTGSLYLWWDLLVDGSSVRRKRIGGSSGYTYYGGAITEAHQNTSGSSVIAKGQFWSNSGGTVRVSSESVLVTGASDPFNSVIIMAGGNGAVSDLPFKINVSDMYMLCTDTLNYNRRTWADTGLASRSGLTLQYYYNFSAISCGIIDNHTATDTSDNIYIDSTPRITSSLRNCVLTVGLKCTHQHDANLTAAGGAGYTGLPIALIWLNGTKIDVT